MATTDGGKFVEIEPGVFLSPSEFATKRIGDKEFARKEAVFVTILAQGLLYVLAVHQIWDGISNYITRPNDSATDIGIGLILVLLGITTGKFRKFMESN